MNDKIWLSSKNKIRVLVIVIGIIVIYMISSLKSDEVLSTNQTTTISECVSMSKNVRINPSTKECFDNLSLDEFLLLMDNEESMKLYNDVNAYYDKRTEAQKAEDAKKTEEFFNEVTKNLESNPDAYKE